MQVFLIQSIYFQIGKRRNVISRVAFIQRIYENGQRIPLWLGFENEMPPALCGAIEADDGYVADVSILHIHNFSSEIIQINMQVLIRNVVSALRMG